MSASNLRDRLRSLTSTSSVPKQPTKEGPGLRVNTYRERADEELFAIAAKALERMGYRGVPFDVRRTLFLDTETTGLSGGAGTVAFLVGIGYIADDEFVVAQYMMRDYADEPELLDRVAEHMRGCDVVVTFNGKTFDMPLLESRFIINRMRDRWTPMCHLDLLHPARRLWRRRLGSCRLSNLEDKVLRRGRTGDLPGAEVPERYFEYLKTGDEELLEDVLEHNRLDILSLGALLVALCGAYDAPAEQTEIADLYSMGVAMERIGDADEAMRCFDRAGRARSIQTVSALRGARYAAEADMALAMIYKRRGDYEAAQRLFERLVDKNLLGARPLIELAKLNEHRRRDDRAALDYTDRALTIAVEAGEIEALLHRRARLMRKLTDGGRFQWE